MAAGRGKEGTEEACERKKEPEEKDEDEEEDSGEEEDDSDDDDDESSEMVGYLEDPPTEEERRLLTRRLFPSKVGGRPAWLIPKNLPTAVPGDLACSACARPLRFLLQVYASRGEHRPGAFHRVLHVFVCTSCQPNEVKVFRAQLARENPFYSSEAPNAKKIAKELKKTGDKDLDLEALCCQDCGLTREAGAESSSCTDCQRCTRVNEPFAVFQEREISTSGATVPDEEDQAEEVAGPDVKGYRPGAGNTSGDADAEEDSTVEEVFTEGVAAEAGNAGGKTQQDLVADADAAIASAKAKGASEAMLDKLREYRTKVSENADGAIDLTEQNVFDEWSKENGESDDFFSKFNRYSLENKGHMLRYAFGGEPLWFCGPRRLLKDPPPCQRCGGARVFELQVQAQLISLLGGSHCADRLDFGTICVYTCAESCDPLEGTHTYAEEYGYVQPEANDAWLPKA